MTLNRKTHFSTAIPITWCKEKLELIKYYQKLKSDIALIILTL